MTSLMSRLVLLGLAVAPTLGAQSAATIAARVAGAADGEVRMTYTARPDACGDGGESISFGDSFRVSDSREWNGASSGSGCVHGPARVALTVRDHQVIAVHPHVAGRWPAGDAVLDLGTVPAAQAAAYFVSLASKVPERRPQRGSLLAAVLADSAAIAPDLQRLARDGSVPAVSALGMLEEKGVPALMDVARSGNENVRKSAVFWLGQSDEPPARAVVRSVIDDARETVAVRRAAIFAYGQRTSGASVADLVSLYDHLREPRLREHVIFVLSQRDEESATDALMDIARRDDDRAMRSKAFFWLAQKNDPRVAKMITDIVTH
ncbi:MAG TPA: HEAT repeat domain-containing protein [Gemmatimonadaceae bacterium]|nr:HEAT repeat domain-containing protein [Gemmatimonadaceae bacterium]